MVVFDYIVHFLSQVTYINQKVNFGIKFSERLWSSLKRLARSGIHSLEILSGVICKLRKTMESKLHP